jgi:hypothetical protein
MLCLLFRVLLRCGCGQFVNHTHSMRSERAAYIVVNY